MAFSPDGTHVLTVSGLTAILWSIDDLPAEGEGEGEGEADRSAQHSADKDGDMVVSLSELLWLIQFYNSGGYRTCLGGEDGFCPRTG